jgi:hypothetical protein
VLDFAPVQESGFASTWPYVRDVAYILLGTIAITSYAWSAKSRAEHDRRVRFSSVHRKQLALVSGLYKLLARLDDKFERARDWQKHPTESTSLLNEWGEAANEFRLYFAERRIWLDQRSCTLVDQLWQGLKDAGYAHFDYLRMFSQDHRETDSKKITEIIQKCDVVMKERVLPAKAALEAQFRRLMAVEDPPKPEIEEPFPPKDQEAGASH